MVSGSQTSLKIHSGIVETRRILRSRPLRTLIKTLSCQPAGSNDAMGCGHADHGGCLRQHLSHKGSATRRQHDHVARYRYSQIGRECLPPLVA